MEAMVRAGWRTIRTALSTTICTALMLLWSVGVSADIALLSSSPSKVATSLQTLLSSRLQTPIVLITDPASPINYERYELVIAVGTDAIEAYSPPSTTPVVGAFISQADYQVFSNRLVTAVFVEPPFDRQLRLAQEILGENRDFGVLVQKEAGDDIKHSRAKIYSIEESESLNHTLIKLLAENQALIGVYDPQLYSPDNIKNILITAYRHNRPLIGPSSAYLRAGALATTYSNLDDVAARLSDIISGKQKGGAWPKADFNPYFHVGFNEQVGRSLNLLLPSVEDVTAALHKKEDQQ